MAVRAIRARFAADQKQWNAMFRSNNKGRISTVNFITPSSVLRFACRVSVATTAFLQFPAFFASCTQLKVESSVHIKINRSEEEQRTLDVFFFEAREPFLLDSYQQCTGDGCSYVFSGPGDMIVAALPAKTGDLLSRAWVSRLHDLNSEVFSLENDSPETPLRFGCTRVGSGASRDFVLNINPLICSIRVRSVSCDFSGRPYGVPFHNDKLFLINAVSESCPLAAEGGHPVSWMNYGFSEEGHPYLMANGCGDVGTERVYPMTTLYCYPNPESKPPTRLVLEGFVGETHCYYPIDIPLIKGGTACDFDITIHRIGTDNPDSPASPGMYTVEWATVPWYEYDEREEIY